MALNVRPARPGTIIGVVIVTMMSFLLASCQHTPDNSAEKSVHAWRILERVGDVRSGGALSSETTALRPGETIHGERLVTTGPGALLILAAKGVQLTVSENSSVRLSAQSTGDLFLNRGRLRVRLSRAVDSDARIQTTHFDLNATRTSLLLLAGPNGTSVAVDDGNVRLATANGRHQATLSAGAAAKIDSALGDDLFIRPASGKAFAKVGALSEAVPTDDMDQRPAPLSSTDQPLSKQKLPGSSPNLLESRPSSTPPHQSAIRPASRLKPNDAGMQILPESLGRPRLQPDPAAYPSMMAPSHTTLGLRTFEQEKPVAQPTGLNNFQPADPPLENTGLVDSLQLQFDLLTGGLVDQLPVQRRRR